MNQTVFMEDFHRNLQTTTRPEGQPPTSRELHDALGEAVLASVSPDWRKAEARRLKEKRAAYLSAEFLVGRAVYNNLLSLDLTEAVEKAFQKEGASLADLEEIPDAALGNGGLGRLAACYLDSAATLDIPLDGYGIRYKYGLFRQELAEGSQVEAADDWQSCGDPWSVRREEDAVEVAFADETVRAVPYDMPIIGYGAKGIGTLRLWQSEALSPFDFAGYNRKGFSGAVAGANKAEEISSLLYPEDSLRSGKILRFKQQYFFCNASLQDMLRKYGRAHGDDLSGFPDYFTLQLNDTHPVVAIPDLIRILTAEKGLSFADALDIARRTFAYTNHTVMPEALEKWNTSIVRAVVPEVLQVVTLIDKELQNDLRERKIPRKEWWKYRILCAGQVHMARLASYVCHHINGVSELHTEILKSDVLAPWYEWYPERFVNVTNGVTQRRWLALCNPRLSGFITEQLGSDRWITDLPALGELKAQKDNREVLERFAQIKGENKADLSNYLRARHGISLDPAMVFDVQIKRFHEYKRQLLNALGILDLYFGIKSGEIRDFTPTAFLFGGKSAPGYFRAKGIIRYINEIAALVNNDPDTARLMQVVFVPDYNVSVAEKMVAAAELSEQISTAGTEASGTGNMKLTLNGAPTIGTYDGANIEIFRHTGLDNNYLFGARVEEIDAVRELYDPKQLYEEEPRIRAVLNTLTDGTFDDGGSGAFQDLYSSLLEGASWHEPDHYFLLLDFLSYRETRLRANADCKDRLLMARKGLLNTAGCGIFSSDRSVREYAANIWGVRAR